MLTVLAALFAASLAAPLLVRWWGRSAFYVLALAPAAAFVWLFAQAPQVLGAQQAALAGQPHAPPGMHIPWVAQIGLDIDLRLDALSFVLCLLILGVGALVLAYCARYFKSEDASIGPFAAQLTAFAASMFGLVIADNLILLFVFWETTTILSYLLIGYARTRMFARRSALTALVVTTAGGLAMLVGLIALGQLAGTMRLSEILAMGPTLVERGGLVDVAVALILVGAVSKSALVPLHFWLPGAMAAPTPVSAYLHAAAMVKAGVYLVARFAPGFSGSSTWLPIVVSLGLLTLLVGGWRALRQDDIKLILAYGTVSQLGLLVLVTGLGTAQAALAGLALMLSHGLFKSALFLTVGIIDHGTGTRDLTKLSGLWRRTPLLFGAAVISAASMAGVPPVLGFVAKESVLGATTHLDGALAGWVTTGVVLGSMLTFAYAARFVWGAFATKPGVEPTPMRAPEASFAAAPLLLAALTLLFGLWPAPLEAVIEPYAETLPGADQLEHLALWHGFTLPLGLTVLTIAVGVVLFLSRAAVASAQDKLYPLFEAERTYRWIMNGLDALAVRLTGMLQRGSLAYYLVVILITATLAPAIAAVINTTPWPAWDQIVWADSLAQLVIGVAIVIGAVAAVRAHRRFMAVLMVSITGYGMAAMFAFQGAPDLAVTQILVETIVLVAFVLALRVLPPALWTRRPRGKRALRLVVAIGFGVSMMAIGAIAMASRVAEPISLQYPKLAYEGGNGKNIVNVTLVDLRAWDTFGELTVLAAAATGIASLIFVVSRGDRARVLGDVASGSIGGQGSSAAVRRLATSFVDTGKNPSGTSSQWLVAGRTLAPERRSIIIEVVTRLVFHTLILLSVYLLLAGHNSPGGGFAGGLLAGLALTLRYLAGGRVELFEALRLGPGTLLGSGLLIAAASGIAPLFFGGQLFQSLAVEFNLLGTHKFVTSTFFDIGVYLVVVGLVLDVLTSLGAELDTRMERVLDAGEAGRLAEAATAGGREAAR